MIDIFDTTGNGTVNSYEIYVDGVLVAYLQDGFLGNDATGNLNLYDANDVLKISDERMYADKEAYYANKERYR